MSRLISLPQPKQTFLIGLTVLVLVLTNIIYHQQVTSNPHSLQAVAQKVVLGCAKEGYHPGCYEKEIPQLTSRLSMEDSFRIVSLVQAQDPDYTYCHALGHILSSREVDKDPSKWKEVLSRCPVGVCGNGCLHGVTQERFKTETLPSSQIMSLISDLNSSCRSKYTSDIGACDHGMGHLLFYLTGGSLRETMGFCDEYAKVAGSTYSSGCYDGLFMQVFQPDGPESISLLKTDHLNVNSSNARSFCESLQGFRKWLCWEDSWIFFQSQLPHPQFLSDFCAVVTDSQLSRQCLDDIFGHLVTLFNYSPQTSAEFCNNFPNNNESFCFSSFASHALNAGQLLARKAVDICNLANIDSVKQDCYQSLIKSVPNTTQSVQMIGEHLCPYLPDNWTEKCILSMKGRNNIQN